MFCVICNAIRKDVVIHDDDPAGCSVLVDIVSSFGASTNPDSGILVEWSQHEQYSKPTPLGWSFSDVSGCRGDPLLIGLKCPVTYKLVLTVVQFFPQHLRPFVVHTLRTPNGFLQCLDTIFHKVIGRNRKT